MAVRTEAFLALEQSLNDRTSRAIRREALPIIRKVTRQVGLGDFDRAHDIVEEIKFDSIDRQRKYVELVGLQAALYGASRVRPVKRTSLAQTKGIPEQVRGSTNIFITELKKNVAEAYKRALHEKLDRLKADASEASVRKYEPRDTLSPYARDFESFADGAITDPALIDSSLHTSRMSVWGALIEAEAVGYSVYEINEQLDSRTCPICESMHGTKFSVREALGRVTTVLDTSTNDPEAVRSIATWPKQDKESVAQFKQMTRGELMDHGWDTPPYHPLCRGIVIPIEESIEIITTESPFGGPGMGGIELDHKLPEWWTQYEAKEFVLNNPTDVWDLVKDWGGGKKEPFGEGDLFLAHLYKKRKYNGKPLKVDQRTFDAIETNEYGVLHRNVFSDDQVQAFKVGDYYAGQGMYGNGTYVAYGSDAAEAAAEYGKATITMKLNPNAKVAKLDEIAAVMDDETEKALSWFTAERKRLRELGAPDTAFDELARMREEVLAVYEDPGRMATYLGYDAIDVPNRKFMVILNRRAVVVPE